MSVKLTFQVRVGRWRLTLSISRELRGPGVFTAPSVPGI